MTKPNFAESMKRWLDEAKQREGTQRITGPKNQGLRSGRILTSRPQPPSRHSLREREMCITPGCSSIAIGAYIANADRRPCCARCAMRLGSGWDRKVLSPNRE